MYSLDGNVEMFLSDVERFGDVDDFYRSLFVSVISDDQLHLARSSAFRIRKFESLLLKLKN